MNGSTLQPRPLNINISCLSIVNFKINGLLYITTKKATTAFDCAPKCLSIIKFRNTIRFPVHYSVSGHIIQPTVYHLFYFCIPYYTLFTIMMTPTINKISVPQSRTGALVETVLLLESRNARPATRNMQ